MASLAQRAFIVTGGFSGIGLATARKLIARAATVHILDRAAKVPSELIEASAASLKEKKVFTYSEIDVTSRSSVRAAIEAAFQKTPDVSGLVNSAGVCPSSGQALESEDVFDNTVAVNLNGTWNVTNAVVRQLIQQNIAKQAHDWQPGQSGLCSIVNIGSSASYYGYETLAAYTASKHAVLGLTRSWALDFAPYGIRSNLVAPGGTNTPLSKAQFDDKERGDMSRAVYPLIPLKRFAEPEEIADAVCFLLSDEASYITGQVLKVNGGWP